MCKKPLFILLIMALLVSKAYSQLETARLIITDGLDKPDVKARIEKNASLLLTAMGKAMMEGELPDLSVISITPEASKTLLDMWVKTSAMSCPVTDVDRKCLQRPQGGYQVRDIPVTMMDAPEEEQAQDLVLNFTEEGKIDDVLIAIHIYESPDFLDIQNISSEQDRENKQRILEFLEQFRTAYNTKDIIYMQAVFNNTAIIGTKEKPNSGQILGSNLNTERIEYVIQTKEQYLRKLKMAFSINKYISVRFSEIEIVQHQKYPKIYGASFTQDWQTANYYYKSYIFFIIDFKNEKKPLIHFFTLQPDKYNGEELSKEKRFSLDFFQIFR